MNKNFPFIFLILPPNELLKITFFLFSNVMNVVHIRPSQILSFPIAMTRGTPLSFGLILKVEFETNKGFVTCRRTFGRVTSLTASLPRLKENKKMLVWSYQQNLNARQRNRN